MSGPKIPIEVDTSGVERALERVEQRAKRTSRTLNEAMSAGWSPTGGAPGAGPSRPQGGSTSGSTDSAAARASTEASKRLAKAADVLIKMLGRPVSHGEASSVSDRFDALARSGAYGTRRLAGYSGVGDWLGNYQNNFLHSRDANRHFSEVARRIGLDVPNQQGGRGFSSIPYRMVQRVAPMFGGAGSAVGQAAGEAATAGGSALGMAGRFLGGAGIGAAMYAGYKVFHGVGDAGNEMTGYTDLRAKLGPLTTDFDRLRDSVRFATKGLGLTYEEAQKMAAGFAHTANTQAEDAGELHDEVKNAGGFGRGFGMDPSQANDFFAQMRHYQVTGTADDSRRLAVMIGDSVAKGGNTSKADEVLAAVSNFTAIAARQSLSSPNVEGFASMLASMTGLHLPGLDPSGAASTLGKLNGALSGGGAAGEASQNFSLGLYQRALPGFDALDMGVIGSVGAFGTVGDAFGEDSAAYKAGDEATKARYRGYTDSGADRRIIDMQMAGLRKQYGGNSRMYREAGARHLGLSSVEFSAFDMASQKDGGIGGLMDKLEKAGVKTSGLNTKSIAALAQLQGGGSDMLMAQAKRLEGLTGSDALSGQESKELTDAQKEGGEKLREVVLKLTAQHDTVKDEGQRTRDSIADVKNSITEFSTKLVPLANTMKDGIVEMVRKFMPDSDFIKGQDAEKSRISGMEANGRNAIAGYDNGISKLQSAIGAEKDPDKKAALESNLAALQAGKQNALRQLSAAASKEDVSPDYRKWLEGISGQAIPNNSSPGSKVRAGSADRKTREGIMAKIRAEAERQGVPPEVALALAKKESGFAPNAEGPEIKSGAHKGDRAYGVFQYMGATAKGAGIDRYNVDDNIRQGIADLKRRKEKYGTWGAAFEGHLGGDGAIGKGARSDGNATTFDYRKLGNAFESGQVPGAGLPGAVSQGPRKSVIESRVILQDQRGNQLYEPIVQTHFGAPVAMGEQR